MNSIPNWVTTSVGLYAVLGSVFFLVLIVVIGYLIVVLSGIAKQVAKLTSKVETLTDSVQTIAQKVNAITTEVGARTTGIVRMVDDSAGNAIRILETLAPVLLVVGAFWRLKRFAGRR